MFLTLNGKCFITILTLPIIEVFIIYGYNLQIAPKDDGNYTDRKYFRTSSGMIKYYI